jgi:DEAD/DEAH box helicase domain-containing protein
MEPLIDEFIQSIKRMQSYKKQIVHIEEIPPQEACYGKLEKTLPENIQNCLLTRKIHLYSHQTEAINKVRQGKNVVIVTPTASGKTLAFNIPVLETLTKDNKATALYLYPTKALTNDQLKVIRELEKETGIQAYPNGQVYAKTQKLS